MNEIQIFDNAEFGEIRTIDENGKVLFCGADIAKALGYSNSRKALSDHCKEKGVTKRDTLTKGGIQELTYIDEGNVYRLITHSKLPNAERFESWVFDEVLPKIRRTGSYKMPDATGNEKISDIEEKRVHTKIASKLLDVADMDGLPNKYKNVLIVMASEIMLGKTISEYLQEVQKQKTYLAGDIAKIFGTTAYQIGCIANVFGMKNQEYGEWYYVKPADSEKIRAFKYNEKALEKFGLIFELIQK